MATYYIAGFHVRYSTLMTLFNENTWDYVKKNFAVEKLGRLWNESWKFYIPWGYCIMELNQHLFMSPNIDTRWQWHRDSTLVVLVTDCCYHQASIPDNNTGKANKWSKFHNRVCRTIGWWLSYFLQHQASPIRQYTNQLWGIKNEHGPLIFYQQCQ